MLQPTEEDTDRTKHKFMVQALCLPGDVSVDDLDATVSYTIALYTCCLVIQTCPVLVLCTVCVFIVIWVSLYFSKGTTLTLMHNDCY